MKYSPYMIGFEDAANGCRFDKNPYSRSNKWDWWMMWNKGWLEYSRNNP